MLCVIACGSEPAFTLDGSEVCESLDEEECSQSLSCKPVYGQYVCPICIADNVGACDPNCVAEFSECRPRECHNTGCPEE